MSFISNVSAFWHMQVSTFKANLRKVHEHCLVLNEVEILVPQENY